MHHEDGGLNMLDVFTFLASMKITWLRRIVEESSYSKFAMDIYPDLTNCRGEYENILYRGLRIPL